jgi:mono/diheme cytochrome c family protein
MKTTILILSIFLAACGGEAQQGQQAGPAAENGLSAEQLENGIGPVSPFEVGPIDPVLAKTGLETFTTKCSACHKIDERYVGPALGDVTTRRTPAYIMNMILNPEEMIQKHPEAKALFAQFMTPMANQHLTEDEARAVLEYLRQQAPTQ